MKWSIILNEGRVTIAGSYARAADCEKHLQRKRARKTVSSEDYRLKPEELKGADDCLAWGGVMA